MADLRARRAAAWCAEAFEAWSTHGRLLLADRLSELLGSLLRFHLHMIFDRPSRAQLRAGERGEAGKEALASFAAASASRGSSLRFYVPKATRISPTKSVAPRSLAPRAPSTAPVGLAGASLALGFRPGARSGSASGRAGGHTGSSTGSYTGSSSHVRPAEVSSQPPPVEPSQAHGSGPLRTLRAQEGLALAALLRERCAREAGPVRTAQGGGGAGRGCYRRWRLAPGGWPLAAR